MDIQALIAAKQKEMAAKKARQNTLKPQPGQHKYRILPSWRSGGDSQFWHDFSMHFIKTPDSADKPAAVYVCAAKTYGKSCDVCEAIKKSMGVCGDDKLNDFLKKAQSAQRYLLNVLHLTGPEPTKPQVLEVGQGVFENICALIGEYGDITCPDTGTDIIIKREGSGLETKYTVMSAAKSQPVPKSVLGSVTNLDEFVAQENPAGQAKALGAVGNIIGIMAPAVSAPARGHAALADLSSVEDAEFTPVRSTASASVGLTAGDLDDLDDLDALLEG